MCREIFGGGPFFDFGSGKSMSVCGKRPKGLVSSDSEDEDDEEEEEEEPPKQKDGTPARRTTRIPKPREHHSDTWQGRAMFSQGGEKWNAAEARLRSSDAEWTRLVHQHNFSQTDSPPEGQLDYELEKAFLVARIMVDINLKTTSQGASFVQQYILQKGLKKFGDEGRKGMQLRPD